MNTEKFAGSVGKLALVLLVFTTIAALDRTTVARNVAYHATYVPITSKMTGPFTGDMTLTFNRGTISGTYSDTSKLAQAPFFGQKNATVVGSIDTEGTVTMHIAGKMSIRGTTNGNMITGTAIVDQRQYTFRASPASSM
jgi:hypothetical protein